MTFPISFIFYIPDIFYLSEETPVNTSNGFQLDGNMSVSILGVLHISAFSKLFCFQERHQIMKVKSRFASDKKRTNLSNSLLESKSSEYITEAVFSEIVKGVPMSSRVIYYSIAQIQ